MLYHIYCDESRQNVDRYMALGGIITRAEYVAQIDATMKRFREETNMRAELKWSKVSGQKLPEYKRFVEYFFALSNTEKARFHCLLIDNHQVDHRQFNQGDRETGFYKFYYQLLLNAFGRRYCRLRKDARFLVHLDHRHTNYSLADLKNILNHGIRKRYGVETAPFHAIEPRHSHNAELIQIADLIMGAVGFQKNGYHLLDGTKKAKIELADYIATQAGLPNLVSDTKPSNRRFTIWNFRLQAKNKRP